MRKKFIFVALFIVSLSCFFFPKTASATTFQSGIDDSAQLLGNDLANLEASAQGLASQTKAGIFVVTTESDQPADEMARSYLADKVGAGNNGAVLVINMNLRKVYIWATGNLKYYLPSSRIESTLDVVQPALSANDYRAAVSGFFDKVSTYYQNGIPTSRKYTVDSETGKVTFHRSFQPLALLLALLIALVTGGLFAWNIYRSYQMKDRHAVWRYDYGHNGELKLTKQQDILVNTFITTRPIPRPSSNNSGGFSGGGGSGGGRSF